MICDKCKCNFNPIEYLCEDCLSAPAEKTTLKEYLYDEICKTLDDFIYDYGYNLYKLFPGSVMNQTDVMHAQEIVNKLKHKFLSQLEMK